MRAVWAWRMMMLVAMPALALLAFVLAAVPPIPGEAGQQSAEDTQRWMVALVLGVLAVLGSIVLRRRGQMGGAIVLAAIVALPALLGFGLVAFILLLFIVK
ncbi:hypothetical protein [Falsiroseomonas sp.]|uniref:hypothetical protein n=1 Tax=Falsiroseomonas sp. TaxID=2870721 RepID=UPI003564D511